MSTRKGAPSGLRLPPSGQLSVDTGQRCQSRNPCPPSHNLLQLAQIYNWVRYGVGQVWDGKDGRWIGLSAMVDVGLDPVVAAEGWTTGCLEQSPATRLPSFMLRSFKTLLKQEADL